MHKLLYCANAIISIMGATSSLFFATSKTSAMNNFSQPPRQSGEGSSFTKPLKLHNSLETWTLETKRSLTEVSGLSRKTTLPSWLQQELLDETDSDFHIETWSLDKNEDFLIKGVPRRPFYKEVAFRIFQWNQRIQQSKVAERTGKHTLLMVPAEKLNLEELESASNSVSATPSASKLSLTPPPDSSEGLDSWFQTVDAFSILRLLGMRHTIGSDGGIIPSRHRLLQACRAIHKPDRSKLTVAARARSKHAHRSVSQESFFGVAKGPAEVQNDQTEGILNRLLEDAVWINRHRFVGLEEGVVAIEIRVLEGYGARWVLDNNDDSITFRGFLEPQMKDGHERKWQH